MNYMLDTDTVSFALRGQGRVGERLLEYRPSQLYISALTLAELRFGADRKKSRKLHRLIDGFCSGVSVVPFDEAAATQFGRLATELTTKGTPIGDFDVLIAAHALSLGLTLVTNNQKHFGQINALRCENWV